MLTRRLISHIFQKLSGYFSKLVLFTLQGAQRFGEQHDVAHELARIVGRSLGERMAAADLIDREIMGRPSRRQIREAFGVPKRFGET